MLVMSRISTASSESCGIRSYYSEQCLAKANMKTFIFNFLNTRERAFLLEINFRIKL